MDLRPNYNTTFNPEKSTYHEIMVKKYIRQGLSEKQAYKRAKEEFKESLKINRLV